MFCSFLTINKLQNISSSSIFKDKVVRIKCFNGSRPKYFNTPKVYTTDAHQNHFRLILAPSHHFAIYCNSLNWSNSKNFLHPFKIIDKSSLLHFYYYVQKLFLYCGKIFSLWNIFYLLFLTEHFISRPSLVLNPCFNSSMLSVTYFIC